MLYVIESAKEGCAALSKNPEDYLCEEEDAASLLKPGFSATQRADDQRTHGRASVKLHRFILRKHIDASGVFC